MSDFPIRRTMMHPAGSAAAGADKNPSLKHVRNGNTVASNLKSACQQFESLFLSMMLKEMRDSIPKSEVLESGQAEEIYTSLLDTQLSHELAQRGGIGLAAILERYLVNRSDEQAS